MKTFVVSKDFMSNDLIKYVSTSNNVFMTQTLQFVISSVIKPSFGRVGSKMSCQKQTFLPTFLYQGMQVGIERKTWVRLLR